MEIFQQCPALFQAERNNSLNFLNSMDRTPLLKLPIQMTRMDFIYQ